MLSHEHSMVARERQCQNRIHLELAGSADDGLWLNPAHGKARRLRRGDHGHERVDTVHAEV